MILMSFRRLGCGIFNNIEFCIPWLLDAVPPPHVCPFCRPPAPVRKGSYYSTSEWSIALTRSIFSPMSCVKPNR